MIIIGDVHGSIKTLQKLISKLPKNREIVFVGDLVDRGPSSREVVRFVRQNNYKVVMGNHELFMIDYPDSIGQKGWILPHNGGMATLKSYSLLDNNNDNDNTNDDKNDRKKIFEDDVEWMASLPFFIEFPDVVNERGQKLIVSHSICFPILETVANDAAIDYGIWKKLNEDTLNHYPIPKDYFNVFGHTVVGKYPIVKNNYACIDTGCYKKDGYLSALLYPEMKIIKQKNIDKSYFLITRISIIVRSATSSLHRAFSALLRP